MKILIQKGYDESKVMSIFTIEKPVLGSLVLVFMFKISCVLVSKFFVHHLVIKTRLCNMLNCVILFLGGE